jgi:hypothetical protein
MQFMFSDLLSAQFGWLSALNVKRRMLISSIPLQSNIRYASGTGSSLAPTFSQRLIP